MISSPGSISPVAALPSDADSRESFDDRVRQSAEMLPQSASTDSDNAPLTIDFLKQLSQLPPSSNPQSYAEEVNKLMHTYVDPSTGNPAFKTFPQQREILQHLMEKVGTDNNLSRPLNTTLCSTINLEFMVEKWMQDIFLSDDQKKEAEEW